MICIRNQKSARTKWELRQNLNCKKMKQIHQTENKLCASGYNATNQVNIHILIQLTYLISLNKGVIRINCMHIMFVFYNSQELL